MKGLVSAIALLVVTAGFFIFSHSQQQATQKTVSLTYFDATVLSVDDHQLLVSPDASSEESHSSDQIWLSFPHMTDQASLDYLTAATTGDHVHIGYTGDIEETYPARISDVYEISLIKIK